MFTIDNSIVSGTDLPGKGRLLLTNGPSFISRDYIQIALLFRNPDSTGSSSVEFMPNDALYTSLEILVRDHYPPLTGYVEIEDTDVYISWDNYKDNSYSPEFPVPFETATIDTDYDTFYKMVQNCDSSLNHSKSIAYHNSKGIKEPLSFIKITRLGSASQAVAVNLVISHIAMDGCSFTIFFLNWAALCRQILEAPEPQLFTDHTKYEVPYPPLFGTPDLGRLRNPENENYRDQMKDEIEDIIDLHTFESNLKNIDRYSLFIPESKQKEIRDTAHSSGLSFNNYLFAILWKEEIAMQFHYNPEVIDNMSSLCIAFDIRPRLGIPTTLCSSASIGCHVRLAVKDILKMSSIEVARKIMDRISAVATPEGICGYIDKHISLWENAWQKDGDAFENFEKERFKRIFSVSGFIMSSLLNFKLPDIDFGFGGPVAIRLPKLPVNGLVHITPPNPNIMDTNIQINITLPKGYNILRSPLFKELVTLD